MNNPGPTLGWRLMAGALVAALSAGLSGCASGRLETARSEMERIRADIGYHLAAQGVDPAVVPQGPLAAVPTESTHLVIIVDTSGSMRYPQNEAIKREVRDAIARIMSMFPKLEAIQMLDGDGRFISGNEEGWITFSRKTALDLIDALHPQMAHSNSSPLPGVQRALSVLYDFEHSADMRLAVFVLADEFMDYEPMRYEVIARRGIAFDPAQAPAIRIHAVQFALDPPFYPYRPMDDMPRFIGPLVQLYRGVYIQWPG